LAGNGKSAGYSQSRTDTLIGAGARIAGNISFTGVLRIQGDVLGDVSCAADANGAAVVGKSGNVTGTIIAPHIVVGGRVNGPVHSSESIEIQQAGWIAGDAVYKEIGINSGGVIEGLLIPGEAGGLSVQDNPSSNLERPVLKAYAVPSANAVGSASGLGERRGGWLKFGGVVVLLVVVATVAWMNRDLVPATPAPADASKKTEASAVNGAPVAQSAPLENSGPKETQQSAPSAGNVSVEQSTLPDSKTVTRAPPDDSADADSDKVVVVQGVNPGKPAGVFSVIGNEPAVLFKKKRQDPGEGTRIDVPQGPVQTIAIARNEIFRVAQGRNINVFYQGRKVAPKAIESGAWMGFVPQAPSAASDNK
jgi:cytoskeletal protein CcmA (bactofilin family)